MITSGGSTFECADCGVEIDLKAYQRKIPRCDRCEGNAWWAALSHDVDRSANPHADREAA